MIASEQAQHELLAWWANCLGLTGAPFDSFLTLRGLRTLVRHAAASPHLYRHLQATMTSVFPSTTASARG